MATFIFDGTTDVTAAKTDTVVIAANPALFTNASETGNNVVFNFGGKLLTVTGTTFGDNTTQYPNVSITNGTFSTGIAAPQAPTTANDLIIGSTGTVDVSAGGTAAGVKAVFGGLGTSDPTDGDDAIVIGGKGSFLVYGNAGIDTITQTNAFDSSSFVTVFGGKGQDGITLTGGGGTNTGAKFAVYGGESTDTISITNTGSGANTAIFGGQGAADSSDLGDQITFNGGGTVNIFGNAGNDTIILGNNGVGLDSTAAVTIRGGLDADNIIVSVANVKASLVLYGDENNAGDAANNDQIAVGGNAGTTVIFGGTAAADSLDNADIITYGGQGTATIYAAGGADTVNLLGTGVATADSTSTTTVFGGNGNDSINLAAGSTSGAAGTNTGTISITVGAGADVVTVGGTTNVDTAAGVGSAGTGQGITVTDFVLGTGNDKIFVNNGIADGLNAATLDKFIVDGSGATTIQQALNIATSANGGATPGTVSLVAFQGNSYIVVNQDGDATFAASTDLAIKLTGVTDLAALATATTII